MVEGPPEKQMRDICRTAKNPIFQVLSNWFLVAPFIISAFSSSKAKQGGSNL